MKIKSKADINHTYCKDCDRILTVEYIDKQRKLLRQMALDYAGGKCSICGFDKYSAALDFHHIDPKTKIKQVGQMCNNRASWKSIRIEIDKCILLCSNCHRGYHAGELDLIGDSTKS